MNEHVEMDLEHNSEEEHNLSRATQGCQANKSLDGLGITSMCEDAEDEMDKLEEHSGLRPTSVKQWVKTGTLLKNHLY